MSDTNETKLSLANSCLAGASFKDGNYSYIDFTNCDLRGADFSGADLTGSVFDGADLRGSSIKKARSVAKCSFRDAKLDGIPTES